MTIGPPQTAQRTHIPLWPFSLPAAGFVLAGASCKRRKWLILALLLAVLVGMIACGGAGNGSTAQSSQQPVKPSTTTVVTITGTSGGVTHSAGVSLTLQQP